jgi:hypothetical protein
MFSNIWTAPKKRPRRLSCTHEVASASVEIRHPKAVAKTSTAAGIVTQVVNMHIMLTGNQSWYIGSDADEDRAEK